MKRLLLIVGSILCFALSATSHAETRSDVYNGATCVPYPAFNSSNAVPYSFYLYGFRQSAYCHFMIPDDWAVTDLSYVLFHGVVNPGSGPMRVRLCVYSAIGISTTCGTERTISDSGNFSTNWVPVPSSMPNSPMGGYLSVRFPTDVVSTFNYFIPVFIR